MKEFADDTKTASVSDCLDQCEKIQEQVNCRLRCAEIWQMSFNLDKYVVMHLCRKNLRRTFFMDGLPMKVTECEKDIGVYMHSSLKRISHIAEAVKRRSKLSVFS